LELKIDAQVRGTRILALDEARKYRFISNTLAQMAQDAGGEEIILPIVEPAAIYTRKLGASQALRQIYVFPDKQGRALCLRPQGAATCQIIADTIWKNRRDVLVYYLTKCWRYERPQLGRYREFTQFGVEMLNPRRQAGKELRASMVALAETMVRRFTDNYEIELHARRGLTGYGEDGFEICCSALGGQKRVCGGGCYRQGCGFALGVDRLMLLWNGKKGA
jgi:histidyl-tRNA synthetase